MAVAEARSSGSGLEFLKGDDMVLQWRVRSIESLQVWVKSTDGSRARGPRGRVREGTGEGLFHGRGGDQSSGPALDGDGACSSFLSLRAGGEVCFLGGGIRLGQIALRSKRTSGPFDADRLGKRSRASRCRRQRFSTSWLTWAESDDGQFSGSGRSHR